MPVIFNEHYKQGFVVGLWEILEDLEELRERMIFTEQDVDYYQRFLVEKRQKHWLASRLLLKELAGGNYGNILYDQNGKPFFSSGKCHLSYSHAGTMAAAIISETMPVGIDVERVTPKLLGIKDRFLSDEELVGMGYAVTPERLCLGWCGKEALYKIYGQRRLDFRDHIRLILPEPKDSGFFDGTIVLGGLSHQYKLNYFWSGDYVTVYVAGGGRFPD